MWHSFGKFNPLKHTVSCILDCYLQACENIQVDGINFDSLLPNLALDGENFCSDVELRAGPKGPVFPSGDKMCALGAQDDA